MHADAEETLWSMVRSKKFMGRKCLSDSKTEKIEYNSLINIRPSQNNRSLDIQDDFKEKIKTLFINIAFMSFCTKI